jgi:uncharacterized membrane protein YphA (DoxX/SURF4 family)
MGFRESLGLNITPLLLRVGLGVVFLWAGGSKILYRDQYSGAEAAILAKLGIVVPVTPGVPVSPVVPSTPEAAPAPQAEPAAKPVEEVPAEPKPIEKKPVEQPVAPAPGGGPSTTMRGSGLGGLLVVAQVAPGGAVDPAASGPKGVPAAAGAGVVSVQRVYRAEDFPTPVTVTRLYSLAMMMHSASQPDEHGRRLWPERLSSPSTIKVMCWVAALTEFLGGALVLVGFLTRVWSLALAGTMATAMLLTTIGPAVLSGVGFLGFLPAPMLEEQSRWVGAWTPLLFQLVLMLMALGVALSGPGAVSIDRLLFRSGGARGSSDSKE